MRKIISLNQGWTFYKEGAAEKVNLPHTWNGLDGQDGGDDYYRGSCYYERSFERPALADGERVYLEFQGVNSTAEVSVNGFLMGKHKGGYSAFRFDVTDVLKETNRIEVVADNSPCEDVYPQKADFTFYGGIYRDVNLIVAPGRHFALDYFGGPGVKVTPVVRDGRAEVQVKLWLEGGDEPGGQELLEVEISCREGVVARVQRTAEIASEDVSGNTGIVFHLTIENPHLWQGVEDPYLYTLTARILMPEDCSHPDGEFVPADEVSLRFGCRSFSVDPDRGFLLNGKEYPLHGVSRHQDREGVGNALTRKMHREDMELIREIGVNSIRLAHYQHHQYFYDLCDEYGMVVWAEIPYITCHMDAGRENTLTQMRELIVQNHHHASICFWGISNEVTVGGVTEGVLENNRALQALCKELDPERLTTMACAFMLEDDSPMLEITDLVSYNHYFGWYHGEAEDNDRWFDDYREKYPHRAVGLSEYGAEAVLKWQTGKPERGDYTEQYQALYHEHMLEMLKTRPWIWCAYVWNMFDFAADGRDEGGVKGRNNKGLVTFDRRMKKDAFYLYKAYWSGEPFVHIAGKRYVNRAEKKTQVVVYSNRDRVELYCNGKPEESRTGAHVFRFAVTLESETVILVKAGEDVEDSVILRYVDVPDPAYVLPVQGEVENWFHDLTECREDCFSLEDRVGELAANPAGLQVFRDFMAVYDSRKKGAAAASHMTEEQRLATMRSMRLKELMKRTNTPGEEVRLWLEKLQQIKKEGTV